MWDTVLEIIEVSISIFNGGVIDIYILIKTSKNYFWEHRTIDHLID